MMGLEPVPNTVLVSATKGWGTGTLKETIESELNQAEPRVEVMLPYSASDLVDLFHRRGVVEFEEHGPEGTSLRGTIPARYLPQLEGFLTRPVRGAGGRRDRAS